MQGSRDMGLGNGIRIAAAAALAAVVAAGFSAPASAQSGARKQQERKTAEIPVCAKRLGTIAVVEPDNDWWRPLGLGSPEAIIKTFVMRSGCFGLVDRGRGLSSRNIERALADQGELQQGSNIGRAQVRAADYFIVPDLVTRNSNAGGGNIGGLVGGMLGGGLGAAIGGGINIRKKEANVTLTLVNARTTEMERLTEGFARKTDLGFGGGVGFLGGGFGGGGGGGYENTEIGQVIVLAYLDAYTNMVRQLGGLPEDASAAAPVAR
jgi:curli biogenesis system outer membrane secretion channel CsgG